MAYGNSSEINRLQKASAERRSQLEGCYALLGRQYVERHRTESDNEFALLIGTISEHEATLKAYDDQILELRGFQRCTKCGAEIPLTSRFCNTCGAKAPEPPAGQMRCPTCGKLLPVEARFCNGCGNPIAPVTSPYAPPAYAGAYTPAPAAPAYAPAAPVAPVVPAPAAPVAPAVPVAPAPTAPAAPTPAPAAKICPNCGASVESDCLFCTECGTKL